MAFPSSPPLLFCNIFTPYYRTPYYRTPYYSRDFLCSLKFLFWWRSQPQLLNRVSPISNCSRGGRDHVSREYTQSSVEKIQFVHCHSHGWAGRCWYKLLYSNRSGGKLSPFFLIRKHPAIEQDSTGGSLFFPSCFQLTPLPRVFWATRNSLQTKILSPSPCIIAWYHQRARWLCGFNLFERRRS